jgi:hypothetical protein
METTFGKNIETKILNSTTNNSLNWNNNNRQVARVSPYIDNQMDIKSQLKLTKSQLSLFNNQNSKPSENLMTNSLMFDSTTLNNNGNDNYRSLIVNKKHYNNNNSSGSLRIPGNQNTSSSSNIKLSLKNSMNGNYMESKAEATTNKSIKHYNINGYLSDSECNNIYNRLKYKTNHGNNNNENQLNKIEYVFFKLIFLVFLN